MLGLRALGEPFRMQGPGRVEDVLPRNGCRRCVAVVDGGRGVQADAGGWWS